MVMISYMKATVTIDIEHDGKITNSMFQNLKTLITSAVLHGKVYTSSYTSVSLHVDCHVETTLPVNTIAETIQKQFPSSQTKVAIVPLAFVYVYKKDAA